MRYQRTIRNPIHCSGVGLHSGRRVQLVLRPAGANEGITFLRKDAPFAPIKADIKNIGAVRYATSLCRHGEEIATVEHLLAAAHGLGIDNLRVELTAPEVPILDGSAAPFLYLLHEAGIKKQGATKQYIQIVQPVELEDGDKYIGAFPSPGFQIAYHIEYDHPVINSQSRSFHITEQVFVDEIAPARTFGFLHEVEAMRRAGLALGGSLDNAVVIGQNRILNKSLRFPDEFVRHKILDFIGDSALLGHPLKAYIVAKKAGHQLHTELLKKILAERRCWKYAAEKSEGLPLTYHHLPEPASAIIET